MARTYQIISADGHLETPPGVWVKYVPSKWKDRAPRLIRLPDGAGDAWVVEGMPILHNGQNITGGRPVKFRGDSYFNPDGSLAPGAGPADQRLREQDQDGIDCEVLFPPVFSTRFLEGITDQAVYLSMIQAYNTFLGQDYCSVAPDRLIGNGVIPITGIDDAVAELKRCHELGLRSVSFYQFPNGGGSPAEEDDLFWETALDLGMALSPHASFGDRVPPFVQGRQGTAGQAFAGALTQRMSMAPIYSLTQTIASGVLDRFPDLRVYLAETNASWMPAALYFMDDSYQLFKDWFKADLRMMPSEYVRKHFLFSFIRDPMAMKLRDHLPVDTLMWGTDFPHSVGSYPKTREWLDIIFEDVPAPTKRQVLLETPADFFGLDLETPITPTPS